MHHTGYQDTFQTAFRTLTFRSTREELASLNYQHLALGLLAVWLVGMGRHWDQADVSLVQSLGLPSVAFVFGLAAVVWASTRPFGPERWTYSRVLTFLTLAAPPAALYAIPVERIFNPGSAQHVNLAFLAVVSLWRVSLLVFLLIRLGGFSPIRAAGLALLHVSIVVVSIMAVMMIIFFALGGPTIATAM